MKASSESGLWAMLISWMAVVAVVMMLPSVFVMLV
jgi:hypothetical protein